MRKPIRKIEALLANADIRINGSRPWDLCVHDDRLWRRIALGGSLALGNAYVDGWWDAPALDGFFEHLLKADVRSAAASPPAWLHTLKAMLMNLQSRSRAFQVGRAHYDLGNDLYQAMLDRRMMYSCGFWEGVETLDNAQEQKLRMVCEKLRLEPGMRVLDIGCGWGGTAAFAAEQYGVSVTGVTVSEQQARHARDLCRGWPVDIRLQDYRDVEGEFDRVVSLGMFEHVGRRNYRTFMRHVRERLTPDGLCLLHTIGGNRSTHTIDPWIGTHIFPNAMLPSPAQVSRAFEGLLVLEDWHNLGVHYDRTLMAWHDRFEKNRAGLPPRYDERFFRMWRYYLLSCAASFRVRLNQVWQLVLSPAGVGDGYRPMRCAGCFRPDRAHRGLSRLHTKACV